MRFSHRFFLYAPLAACLALIGAVMAYWWFASAAFSQALTRANGTQILPGVTFSYTTKTLAGFPFRVDARLEGVKLTTANARGPLSWASEHLAVHALTYNSGRIILEAAGQQTLTWTAKDGTTHTSTFLPALLRASANLRKGELVRFDGEAIGLSSTNHESVGQKSGVFEMTRGEFHIRHDPLHDTMDVDVHAQDIHLPKDRVYAFGNTIAKFRIDGQLGPAKPFDALLSGHADWRRTLDTWRAANGGFTLDHMDMQWGRVSATGKGTLALDSQHRLKGQLQLMVNGVPAAPGANTQQSITGAVQSAAENTAHSDNGAPVILRFNEGLIFAGSLPAGFLSPLY
jgi:hypothetical protein